MSAGHLHLVPDAPDADAALLAACAAAEPEALGRLFDRHALAVRRFLWRLTGAAEADLQDLVQETFLEVYRAARTYSGRASVRTWIFAVGANLVRHRLRSEGRRRQALARLALVPDAPAASVAAGPDERLELSRLAAAIAALPEDMRIAFVLCAVEGVPGREAAMALGVREGTLGRRVHEARQTLRRQLERETS